MKTLKSILLAVALGLLLSSFTEQGRWVIDPQSRLSIYGSTNVNSFKCTLKQYAKSDTLEYVKNSGIIVMCNKNRMSIPVKGFSCGNNQITKDFQQTLKSDKYPQLDIVFRSFQNGEIEDNDCVEGVVDIVLAGVTKRYSVKYYARVPSNNTILLTGMQTVQFSDFKLTPPQKMMGLIQVQESLDVEFNLTLKAL